MNPTPQSPGRVPQVPWDAVPAGSEHFGVASVAVDSSSGRIYMFTRGPGMVLVYSTGGHFIARWNHKFSRPHGISVMPDGSVYCVDDAACLIRRFDPDGVEIGPTLGDGRRADTGADWSQPDTYRRLATIRAEGGPPFNHPTSIVMGPDGYLYVSDGYGNCRIHRFSAEGEYQESWGRSGSDPGEFRLPHSMAVSPEGLLYVADRENDRIQVFTLEGRFVTELCDMRNPNAVSLAADGTVCVAEGPVAQGRMTYRLGRSDRAHPARISFFDSQGHLLERVATGGAFPPPAAVMSPHDIALDADGAVYSAEIPAAAYHGAASVGNEPLQQESIPNVIKLAPGAV